MKSKIFFTVSALFCTQFFLMAQTGGPKVNPIEVAAFNRLVDFIKTDTQGAKIAEYEKNNISHQGEENVFSMPLLQVEWPGRTRIRQLGQIPADSISQGCHGRIPVFNIYFMYRAWS